MKKLSLKFTDSTLRYVIDGSPISKIYTNGFSGFILSDERKISGACCNCIDKPCMKFSKSEIDSDFFGSFPHNYSLSVCPTDAINISAEGISIDENKCIGCAICMYRCPSSAIAYNNGVCSVQRSSNILPATINV